MRIKDKLFQYWLTQQDIKIGILKMLKSDNIIKSNEIARRLKVSTPLIHYHIHGNIYSELGLLELGLIKRIEENDLLKGYSITSEGEELLKLIKVKLKNESKQD